MTDRTWEKPEEQALTAPGDAPRPGDAPVSASASHHASHPRPRWATPRSLTRPSPRRPLTRRPREAAPLRPPSPSKSPSFPLTPAATCGRTPRATSSTWARRRICVPACANTCSSRTSAPWCRASWRLRRASTTSWSARSTRRSSSRLTSSTSIVRPFNVDLKDDKSYPVHRAHQGRRLSRDQVHA